MRVALFSRVPALVTHVHAIAAAAGHELVGVVTVEGPPGRYGNQPFGELLESRPPGIDVLVAAGSHRFAALLAALDPDVALSGGFPVRIPEDAIAVPRLGTVNGHPAWLPRYRGPNPIGWALRNGDEELGFTFHRLDADFDTGPVLVRGTAPLAAAERAEDVLASLYGLWSTLLPRALERVEAGEAGDPQSDEEATYAGFFEPAFAELDWTRPRAEVHRQVRAWWIATTRDGTRGPIATLDGERVLVRRTRLDDREGGTRVTCGDGPIWVIDATPAGA